MSVRLAINGLGRIGRCFIRAHSQLPEKLRNLTKIVAANSGSANTDILAHLLKHDSIHGFWNKNIKITQESFDYGEGEIQVFAEKDVEA